MWVDLLALVATAIGLAAPRRDSKRSAGAWWRHPGAWLVGICVLIFANQVLVNVYVIQMHHGDATFVSQYLPPGYFTLADTGWMRDLAGWFPHPGALSITILRTQSFLELPFGLAVYLTVARWLDPALMRRLMGWWSLAAASVAYTIVFCLIEADLASPYTRDDIAIRAISGVVTPLVFGLVLSSGEAAPARSPRRVLAFAASAAALGVLVLVMYDTVLLYSLGKVGRELPIAIAALAVLGAARVIAHRAPIADAGPRLGALVAATWYALAWFFVPALAIRYALLGYGSRRLGLALGLVIAVAAVTSAIRATMGERGRRWLPSLAVAVAGAALCAFVAALIPMPHTDARLLVAVAVFVVVATVGAAVLDRVQDLGTPAAS